MKLVNPPKAMIVLVALVCLTLLMIFESIDPVAGAGMMGTIIGYAVGNGVAARKGDPVEPIIGRQRNDQ